MRQELFFGLPNVTLKFCNNSVCEVENALPTGSALRRQFGGEQSVRLEDLGSESFFSEFRVSNPESKARYRVVIRGTRHGDNYCACPDYATNELGAADKQ